MNTVRVQLADRSYDVVIGRGVLGSVAQLTTKALGGAPKRAYCVIDTGVPETMVEKLDEALEGAGVAASSSAFEPSEAVKSIETWAELMTELAATGQERGEPVICLGGGIVGDVGGFVASGYRRGVPVIQCPSTLLAMVDASVGGKTGVNLDVEFDEGARLLKNLVGAFHQPRLVLADTALLDSLDDRQFRAGLAECLKHGLIAAGIAGFAGDDLLGWTETNLDKILDGDHATLDELVTRNVSLKAHVVAGDEHENAPSSVGGRALLNLGHTFGHAIETLPGLSPVAGDPGLSPLLHGEAVALGLVAACATAKELGLAEASLRERVEALVSRAGLPTCVAGLPDNEDLLMAMSHDKKARGGSLRLVLPTSAGTAVVVEDPSRDAIFAGLDAIRG
ncbi:MAG: 3-dehydroquinate synthetase [Phycisphaerales bacterium]|jgi:3-dehydroquinate synthetase